MFAKCQLPEGSWAWPVRQAGAVVQKADFSGKILEKAVDGKRMAI